MFMPDLTQFLQPLSGEYAGFRNIFENIPFHIGYGVETGMLIDIHEKWGLDVMAQVDLDRRVHKNQDTKALGRMAFVIIKTFINRVEQLQRVDIKQDVFDEMIQYGLVGEKLQPETHVLAAARAATYRPDPRVPEKILCWRCRITRLPLIHQARNDSNEQFRQQPSSIAFHPFRFVIGVFNFSDY